MHELKCCYNGADVVGISCYHPTGRRFDINNFVLFDFICVLFTSLNFHFSVGGGVSPGAAAGITSAVFIALIAAIGVYFYMFAGTAGDGGFSNPLA